MAACGGPPDTQAVWNKLRECKLVPDTIPACSRAQITDVMAQDSNTPPGPEDAARYTQARFSFDRWVHRQVHPTVEAPCIAVAACETISDCFACTRGNECNSVEPRRLPPADERLHCERKCGEALVGCETSTYECTIPTLTACWATYDLCVDQCWAGSPLTRTGVL